MKSWTLLASLLVLAGCSPKPHGDAYFPLSVGSQWTYDVTSDIDDKVMHTTQVLSNLRLIDTEQGEVVVRRNEAERGIGIEYWIKSDENAIKRIAQRTDADERARLDANPITVLKLPVAKENHWLVPSQPFIIAAKTELGGDDMKMPKVMLNTTVEATGESVTVPAGTFNDCVRVEGTGSFELYVDAVSGFKTLPIINREWFCKGVGLVKVERVEELRSMLFSGGKITMELVDFKVR